MSRDATTAVPAAPPYGWSVLAGGCVFTLYLATLAPTTAMWDTSEYIAAAKVLGLPHPPGNPLFVIIAHAFGLLPIPVSYAARINILAALCSAVASGVWFLLIDHVLAHHAIDARVRRIIAAAGTLLGATAFTVWNQSVVNEKVYTVSLALFAVITWLMIRWVSMESSTRNDRKLIAVAFLLGAGYAIHPAGLLPALAVVVAVAAHSWRTFTKPGLFVAVAAAFILGLTPFAFEPIRAAQFPAMNEGFPTGCDVRLELSCTFSHKTYERLAANINRDQYGKPSVLDRQVPFPAQAGMWWLYFKWQWFRDPQGHFSAAQLALALLMLALGGYGAVVHWRWDRASFWYWATFMLTLTLLLIYYMNFKYGASQAPRLGNAVPREVRDRDYFYLWSFSAWGVWVAIAIGALWERSRYWAVLTGLCIIPLVANWQSASRRGQTIARDWAVDLLNSVEPYGVLITYGDNDTFPLWYAQFVEGVRRDVTVVITTYLNIDWFARQLIRQPVYRYDAARGPRMYRTSTWPVPAHPVFRMSMAEADSIPDYVELREPQLFRSGEIETRIDPGYLERKDILILRLITDALPERPIYFSPGSPSIQRLGLERYVVQEGLVEHLLPAATGDSTGAALDVARSDALWRSYAGPGAIIRQGDWIDRPSLATPVDYSLLGLHLSAALSQAGDTAHAREIRDETIDIISAARLEEAFGVHDSH